jgi:DNA-binding transcriptional regulator YiaG
MIKKLWIKQPMSLPASLWLSSLSKKAPTISGRDISKLRNRYEMTQEDFAAALNVPRSTLASWEYAKKKPSGAACRLLEIFKSNAP